MDPRFQPHNRQLDGPGAFEREDPHLRRLREQPLVHRSRMLGRLPQHEPGIYTLGGARQIGKTTLCKQWMPSLLERGVSGERMRYVTGELIDDHHALVRTMTAILDGCPRDAGPLFVVVDEITYVSDWDRAVKYLADAGLLDQVVLLLTGSDLVLIQEARVRLPGRRGSADVVDFHLYPLGFADVCRLQGVVDEAIVDAARDPDWLPPSAQLESLFEAFRGYLDHGGYLTAINDVARDGRIRPATYAVYADWLRGDILRRGKREHSLHEVLRAIVRRYGSQVTWNGLARDLSIDHPATVQDYVNLLASMDAVFVQHALAEDRLSAAPKKARRVIFTDPFIHHAVVSWLDPVEAPYERQRDILDNDPSAAARQVEAVVVSLVRRSWPTYYIKAKGEVDVAYVDGRRFWPVEVKWTSQLRPKDLQQIARYPNGRIWDRSRTRRTVSGVPTEPLPLALLRLEQ